jgi:RimJ/RimL family protein N-acetyltransferase
MSTSASLKRKYPWNTSIKNKQPVSLRPLERKELANFLNFSRQLPEEDLLFLTFDITNQTAMEQRIEDIEHGKVIQLVAEMGGKIVGYASLTFNQVNWMRHMGEIRLLVSPSLRGQGLGKLLVNEAFNLAQELHLKKLIARMAAEQRSAQAVFEHLGFKAEALLHDHVIDRQGRTHDLVIMSYDITGFTEQ